jgi:hypothetical protein
MRFLQEATMIVVLAFVGLMLVITLVLGSAALIAGAPWKSVCQVIGAIYIFGGFAYGIGAPVLLGIEVRNKTQLGLTGCLVAAIGVGIFGLGTSFG